MPFHHWMPKNKKMISNASSLGLNVESTLPTIHLYFNYKHKPTIKTFLLKKNAHEIRKKIKLKRNTWAQAC
jgi:hypothetical protein